MLANQRWFAKKKLFSPHICKQFTYKPSKLSTSFKLFFQFVKNRKHLILFFARIAKLKVRFYRKSQSSNVFFCKNRKLIYPFSQNSQNFKSISQTSNILLLSENF